MEPAFHSQRIAPRSRAALTLAAVASLLTSLFVIASPALATEVVPLCQSYSSDPALAAVLRAAGSDVDDPQNANGSSATVWNALLVVPEQHCVEVSFSSYALPNGFIRDADNEFKHQIAWDNETLTVPAGRYNLQVTLPDCAWQVDLYMGDWLQQLNPQNGHGSRGLIDWSANQGEPCEEPGEPDVKIHKEASVSSIKAGRQFEYTLTISNDGDAEATGVTVSDNTLDLPLELSDPVASQGSCEIHNNNLSCDLGSIAAGGWATVTFKATAPIEACPSVVNRATVSADNEPNGKTDNNTSAAVRVDVICASLNIKKVDENGKPLAGAVFEVEDVDGTWTTGNDGKVCITGLPFDVELLVTEIQAPAGYELADPASQMVEVDDDGDCDSPDVVFVNMPESNESPHETPSQPSSPSQPAATPRESTAAGTGRVLPNTAADESSSLTVIGFSVLLGASVLGSVIARRRREVDAER